MFWGTVRVSVCFDLLCFDVSCLGCMMIVVVPMKFILIFLGCCFGST